MERFLYLYDESNDPPCMRPLKAHTTISGILSRCTKMCEHVFSLRKIRKNLWCSSIFVLSTAATKTPFQHTYWISFRSPGNTYSVSVRFLLCSQQKVLRLKDKDQKSQQKPVACLGNALPGKNFFVFLKHRLCTRKVLSCFQAERL